MEELNTLIEKLITEVEQHYYDARVEDRTKQLKAIYDDVMNFNDKWKELKRTLH